MRETLRAYCVRMERTTLLREWDEQANLPLTLDTVSYCSTKKVW